MWFQLQELQDFKGKRPTRGRDSSWSWAGERILAAAKQKEKGVRNGRCEVPALRLGLPASGVEKLGPWGFATEQELLQG